MQWNPTKLSTPGTLLIIDTLHPLATRPTLNLPTFLSSLITPTTSLLAAYHLDVPLSPNSSASAYAPHPLTLLKYLSTTLLTVHSLNQVLARKAAADKSLAEPIFGLGEEVEGVVRGLGGNDARGVVVEMEYRRKSGRAVGEWFFLPKSGGAVLDGGTSRGLKERVALLEDYPLYRRLPAEDDGIGRDEGGVDITFDLGLTEKQRRDREGVVLPYFDAQDGEAVGGRILYDMGEEDDFDEEEDEI